MATCRGQESKGRPERKGPRFVQSCESWEAWAKAASTKPENRKGRKQAKVFLRPFCWANEDVPGCSQRPKEPFEIGEESMELLTCTRCKSEKPANAEFFPLHNKKANGLDSWCRSCRSTYRSEIRRGKYRQFNCDDATIKDLLSIGECVICGTSSEKLVIDHCHKTKTVRGVLCGECNLGLGKFKDDPYLLEFARIYLLSFIEDPEGEKYLSNRFTEEEAT